MTRPNQVREDLYISDGTSARRHGGEFDEVITLSRDDSVISKQIGSHEYTTVHCPLYDGANDEDDFDSAVYATIGAIVREGDVLVHCQAGVSRSSTVLITALAHLDGVTFDEAYNDVWEARPVIAPHPELRKLALNFLDEDETSF